MAVLADAAAPTEPSTRFAVPSVRPRDSRPGRGRVDVQLSGISWPVLAALPRRGVHSSSSLCGVRMIATGPDRPKAATAAPSASPSLAPAPVAVVSIGGLGGAGASFSAVATAVPVFGARSAASGLIKGLRGLSPFDGRQFPRLPWGGKAVPEDQIAFIAAWIDDGCPQVPTTMLRRGRHVARRPRRRSGQGRGRASPIDPVDQRLPRRGRPDQGRRMSIEPEPGRAEAVSRRDPRDAALRRLPPG